MPTRITHMVGISTRYTHLSRAGISRRHLCRYTSLLGVHLSPACMSLENASYLYFTGVYLVGFHEVDRTQTLEVQFGNGEWVETLGQLTLLVNLGTEFTGCSKEQVWQKVTFDVIPNTIAGYRYDAVLSNDDILA